MKKVHKIKVVILVLTLFSTSCSIDDVVPLNQLSSLNIVRDENSAQALLNGVYALWGDSYYATATFLIEAQSDLMTLTGPIGGDEGILQNEILDDNTFIANYYKINYRVINNANWLISNLEAGNAIGLSEMRKNEMLAEAKCQRAMAHFYLLRSFGQFYDPDSQLGIVLRKTPSETLEMDVRSTVQESYKFIISDLQFATNNAPDKVANSSYVSKTLAKAFLAKVYLYKGDYTNAASFANQAINNEVGKALEPKYADVFLNRFGSQEVLFAPYSDGQNENMSGLSQILRTLYAPSLTQLADKQVAETGSLDESGSGFDSRYSYAFSKDTKGPNQHGKYAYGASNFGGASGTFGLTKFYLRLGEIYLIEAEALARQNSGTAVDSKALARLNEIRIRALGTGNEATPTTKNELLKAIFDEKRLELFGENSEVWYDIVRFDRLGDVKAIDLKASINKATKLIFPIPRQALANNNLLVPNPK